MSISKLLLIDGALVIALVPLLLLFQGGKNKSPLIRISDKEALLRETSVKLPEKEKLIELEKIAKNQGSGIEFNSLIGDWKFVSVWKKNQNKEDSVFSSLLRIFCANIKFKNIIKTENLPLYSVIASIQFGLLTIEFSGTGYLKGKQPLLRFYLNRLELKSGSNVLLSRSLKEAQKEKKSFFALIALEENNEWLSARGQGGEVVIWLRD
tara:strand:- start:1125 stop:1751 length:627 start_codon:yes stop_codon:yes gene_type:complete